MHAEAQAAAASARKWVIWSVIIWAVWVVILIIISVAGGLNAGNSSAAMLSTML